MPTAVGLPGTKRDLGVVFVRSVAKLPKVMREGKCASTADDNGSISAWIDDEGKYRCEADRHLRTIDEQTFTTFEAVKKWYAEWLKKIE